MQSITTVYLETNHGTVELYGNEGDTLGSVLQRAGIPLTSVWTYCVYERDGGSEKAVEFISSETKLEEVFPTKIYARLSRNIDISAFSNSRQALVKKVNVPSTEWVFPDEQQGTFRKVICELSKDDCLRLVKQSVAEVMRQFSEKKGLPMIVGVSGGGDSNVLLSALISEIGRENVIPVMILGLPDWNSQLSQAKSICRDLGVQLQIVDEQQTADILNIVSLSELKYQFSKNYPDADFDFLGTWIVRRVLTEVAKNINAHHVAIGANREDLVSEGLARIAIGLPPLPAPFRKIGSVTLVYPMWKVPKKIGDGAYPEYSLANYENRTPGHSRGRNVFYYLAYLLPSIVPGIDLTLLEGFASLATFDPNPFVFDELLSDYVCRDSYTQDQLQKWKGVLDLLKKA